MSEAPSALDEIIPKRTVWLRFDSLKVDPRSGPRSHAQDTTIRPTLWPISTPWEHICRYKSTMGLVTNDETTLCKAFPSTLSDKTLTWFTSLMPGTIDSWIALEKLLLNKFSTARTILKTRGDLANIKQKEDELLLSYRGSQSRHCNHVFWRRI